MHRLFTGKALRPQPLALFLDVDGTLLEIAATPEAVRVEPRVRTLLRTLYACTGGAVALISGRTIARLDELFAPVSSLPAAGLHGFERRNAIGSYRRCPLPPESSMQLARVSLEHIAARYPGTLLEDKHFAFALHYRLLQEPDTELLREVERIAIRVRPHLDLQLGKKVAELRPASATKGAAVQEFLCEPPFCDRWPIYIGDDLTDESAFEVMNSVGGMSIAVNVQRPTAARFRLPDVGAVHAWLTSLSTCSAAPAAMASIGHRETMPSIPVPF